jgi:hypothetical protein
LKVGVDGLTKTNSAYVEAAKAVHKDAPELIEEVRNGRLTIPEARELASSPRSIRKTVLRIVCHGGPKKKVARLIREAEVAVPVVWGTDDDGINVLAVENLAEVVEDLRADFRPHLLGTGLEDIVHGDHPSTLERAQDLLPSPADTDERKADLVVGSGVAGLGEDLGGDEGGDCEGCCPFDEEATAGKAGWH